MYFLLLLILAPDCLAEGTSWPYKVYYEELFSKYECSHIIKDSRTTKAIETLTTSIRLNRSEFEKGVKKSSRYLLDYLESGKSKLHPYYSKFKNGRPYLEGAMMTDQPIFHDWLFKVPLAGTSRYSRIPDLLRVPMSFIMREAIQRLQLRELHIPKKCLIQLFDRSLIDSWYSAEKNNGFLVLTEKEDLFSLAETIAAIHEWSETKQRDIAFQISTLIVETGWADAKLENITMNRGGKILLVDTEPHFGEMEMNWMNDPASQGSKIWKIYDQTINKLNLSMGGSPSPPKLQNILKGLETFADDSLIHKLSVFNEVAKEFIARMRKIK